VACPYPVEKIPEVGEVAPTIAFAVAHPSVGEGEEVAHIAVAVAVAHPAPSLVEEVGPRNLAVPADPGMAFVGTEIRTEVPD